MPALRVAIVTTTQCVITSSTVSSDNGRVDFMPSTVITRRANRRSVSQTKQTRDRVDMGKLHRDCETPKNNKGGRRETHAALVSCVNASPSKWNEFRRRRCCQLRPIGEIRAAGLRTEKGYPTGKAIAGGLARSTWNGQDRKNEWHIANVLAALKPKLRAALVEAESFREGWPIETAVELAIEWAEQQNQEAGVWDASQN